MPVPCPPGFSPDPTSQLPSKPGDSMTRNNGTYVRLKYEWEKADGTANASCGCGQKCTFNMTYGVSSDGSVTVSIGGSGGSIGAGQTTSTELSVDVGSTEYEYVGIKCVLKETKETGTYTTSGGFYKNRGWWSKVKLIWNLAWHGGAALIPTLTDNAPDKTETKYIQAAWKICRKPCGDR